ncbi:anion permease [Candidatus Bipolaricaulota bacterium]|nr:anion permease [Candidatus Bipolaricaulota bacterium]
MSSVRSRHLFALLKVRSATQLAFYLSLFLLIILLAVRLIPANGMSIDWRFLLLLGSFMLISEGLQSTGFMDWIAARVAFIGHSARGLYLMLLFGAFVLAMLITNDAALFAVIPFTIVLARRMRLHLRRIVIYEIIAVNLGSALTPWGNPQNLFIYHYYRLLPGDFFQQSYPFVLIGFAVLFLLSLLTFRSGKKKGLDSANATEVNSEPRVSWRKTAILLIVFVLLVLSVLHIVPVSISAGLLVLYMAITLRDGFNRLDWWLLGTFLLLFPTMSGLGTALARMLGRDICGHLSVYGAGIGISQLISNVPAAMLLARVTADWRSLFYGVNLGGLGTVAASFANLIGLSLYLQGVKDDWKGFLVESLVWNALLLVVLGGAFVLIVD